MRKRLRVHSPFSKKITKNYYMVKTEIKFLHLKKKKERVHICPLSCSLSYPKISAKNIYYCSEKPGETDMAQAVRITRS